LYVTIDYPHIAAELDRIASLDYTQDMQEAAKALAEAIRESQRQAWYSTPYTECPVGVRLTAQLPRATAPINAAWVTWPTD
jgi:hypothetical protein